VFKGVDSVEHNRLLNILIIRVIMTLDVDWMLWKTVAAYYFFDISYRNCGNHNPWVTTTNFWAVYLKNRCSVPWVWRETPFLRLLIRFTWNSPRQASYQLPQHPPHFVESGNISEPSTLHSEASSAMEARQTTTAPAVSRSIYLTHRTLNSPRPCSPVATISSVETIVRFVLVWNNKESYNLKL
jgi:hypothetical protein